MLVDKIMEYESGTLDLDGTLNLFSELIVSGMAWTLQGHYGRTASNLLAMGYISKDGVIQWDAVKEKLA